MQKSCVLWASSRKNRYRESVYDFLIITSCFVHKNVEFQQSSPSGAHKSAVSRVSTPLSPRDENRKDSTQRQQFRATVRSTMTRDCSGRGMDQIRSNFYLMHASDSLQIDHRQKTYAAIIRKLGHALTLRQCQPHSVILTSLLLRKPLQKSDIDATVFEVCHGQLELKSRHETKARF